MTKMMSGRLYCVVLGVLLSVHLTSAQQGGSATTNSSSSSNETAKDLQCDLVAEAFSRWQLDYQGQQKVDGSIRHIFSLVETIDDYLCDKKGSANSKNKCCRPEMNAQAVQLTLAPACAQQLATGTGSSTVEVLMDGVQLTKNQYDVDTATFTLTMYPASSLGKFIKAETIELKFPASSTCSQGAYLEYGPCPAATGCAFQVIVAPKPLDGSKGRCKTSACADSCCSVWGNTQAGATLSGIAEAFKCKAPAIAVPSPKGLVSEVDTSKFPVKFLAIGDWGADPKPSPSGDTNADRRAQLLVAQAMATTAECFKPQFIINTGDNFYDNGLSSGNDSRVTTQWRSVYSKYPSLRRLTWYGVLGNHDYNKFYEDNPLPKDCVTSSWEQCKKMACCYSPNWMYSEHFKDPNWVTSNGSYVVSKGQGLLDVIMFDTNPFMPHYYTGKDFIPTLPGGLTAQNHTKTAQLVKQQLSDSKAVWRIVVGHHTMESKGRRCVPSYKECKPLEPLKHELWRQNIPLALNGHDHSQQLVKNDSGPSYFLTTGAGGRVTDAITKGKGLLWPDGASYTHDAFIADNGFATIALSKDQLVLKIYTIGKNGPQQGLAYQLVLQAKDFKKPK